MSQRVERKDGLIAQAVAPAEPDADCPLCPRLQAFRQANRAQHPDWFNGPVPTFGVPDAKLLIVGLAPGLRGANRTGRPFTGDFAGELLYETLLACGLASGSYERRRDDGLQLIGCAITNAARCVPPENKPLPAEIATCRSFLAATIAAMPNLRAIVALGRIAHDSVVRALGQKLAALPFTHGREYGLEPDLALFDSYHCSRYNTNTAVLTPEMFKDVFRRACAHLSSVQPNA